MMCITTRFQLAHFWSLVPMYLMFRRMRRDLDTAPGLIRYAFLVQGFFACCTLSIWESEDAIFAFTNVPSHLDGVRYAKRHCHGIWSAYWNIDGVSKWADRWPGSQQWPQLTLRHSTHPNRLVPLSAAEVAQ